MATLGSGLHHFLPHTLGYDKVLWPNKFYLLSTMKVSFTAVINHHKFSDLNNTNLLPYNSGHQKSEMGLSGLNKRGQGG